MNETLKLKNYEPTFKHGRGVSELVFIDSILDKDRYFILKKKILKSANNIGIQNIFKFLQDNSSKHKARRVQEYLLYSFSKVLYLSPQLLDLNPIENLWDGLDH